MSSSGHDTLSPSDWTARVFRRLSEPATPVAAAEAAAAAWIVAGQCRDAWIVLFQSSTECVVAHAECDQQGKIHVSAEIRAEAIAALFTIERLRQLAAVRSGESVPAEFIWRDVAAACFVNLSTRDFQRPPVEKTSVVVRQILGNATSRQTVMPDAAHLEAMAEFAAGAGHEINNPLGSIIGQTQLLLKEEDQPERRQAMGTIGSQAWRIRDMIGDCMLFARPPRPDLQEVRLGQLVQEAASRTLDALSQSSDCLELDLPLMPLTMSVDSAQMQTLVGNLIRNAVEAAIGESLEPQISISLTTDASVAVLTIEDRGPGFQDDTVRQHLFDPFYSGRQAGRGIGFGLPVCWQIVRTHAGIILMEDTAGGGTRFVVLLPRSR